MVLTIECFICLFLPTRIVSFKQSFQKCLKIHRENIISEKNVNSAKVSKVKASVTSGFQSSFRGTTSFSGVLCR